MNLELNARRLDKINDDFVIQNLFAQANSRYILLNTSENRDRFPAYTIEDSRLNILAFYYLDIGCSFAENGQLESGISPLEKGALLLENVHGAKVNQDRLSNYYSVVSALSYYAAYQYSKAFILINKTQSDTIISNLVSLFLKRNFVELSSLIDQIVVDPQYVDEILANIENEDLSANKIYEIIIARSLNGFIKYFQTGNLALLEEARERLRILKEIAEDRAEPSVWWVIRLLIIISDGFSEASLWQALNKHFDINSDILRRYIYSLVYQKPRGIFELFITQRKSLTKVLNDESSSCVVTIPTSSGKTRIAEIAIVKSFVDNPDGKVLYLAPFRSLAFEVEIALEKVLSNIGFSISQLYGGSVFSPLDQKIIDESNIIIATPEKAKAMLRANPLLANEISLIIIDEGHLLGPDKRLVVNEIFYEELRLIADKNNAKFLLLSAVLPNADELALWLANSKDAVFKDTWRPSDERLGILEWNGTQVNLEWINNDHDRPSFNNRFIVKTEIPLIGKQRKIRFHPGDKNEAVAATAYKLRNFGTVLIFVGIKDSVFTMAEAYLKALNGQNNNFDFNNALDWKAFELSCIETYGVGSKWLSYARNGILCHHGSLHTDVRLPLERLMRNSKPLVIISTSTLGQGVNLGVSTVIFSTLHQGGSKISGRDFWNIAGRAGRAFIDHEGKIIVATDTSDQSSKFKWLQSVRESRPRYFAKKKKEKIDEEYQEILSFFNKDKIDIAQSGILILVRALVEVAQVSNIDFDTLLQLISENNLEGLGASAQDVDETLDWIDDTLLSLHSIFNVDKEVIDYAWVEDFFRRSLGYIQIEANSDLSKDNFTDFLQARVRGIIAKVGSDRARWSSIIQSGIPLNSILYIEGKIDQIISVVVEYSETGNESNDKVLLLLKLTDLIKGAPALEEHIKFFDNEDFTELVKGWILARSISELLVYSQAETIIVKLFTYMLPWILNGAAKKVRSMNMEQEAAVIEEMSVLLEMGLPNLKAVKIYQAGIRSRFAANELSDLFNDENWEEGISFYKTEILSKKEFYKDLVSEYSSEYIDMLSETSPSKPSSVASVPDFTFNIDFKKYDTLIAKMINGFQYLMSPNLEFKQLIEGGNVDFSSVNDISGIYFAYDPESNLWKIVNDNPHVVFA